MSGILVLQISLDHFLEQLSTVKVGGEGFVYLVDQTGHAVAHPKYLPQGEIIDLTPVESAQRVKNLDKGSGKFIP